MKFSDMQTGELNALLAALSSEYADYLKMGLKLDLSRGKPSTEQLDISSSLLVSDGGKDTYLAENGFDCRNYGIGDGLPEMRRFFAEVFSIPEESVIVGGNSSLNLIYDAVERLMLLGTGGNKPWCKYDKIKFICPVPGYDRHFGILEMLGIEMLPVETGREGPDMYEVERLSADPLVKGIICVPKYSNPTGFTYSEATVRRLFTMKAAPDFRIFFDNAYGIHDFGDQPDVLPDLFGIAKECEAEDRLLYFTSTSKITFPGGGVSLVASCDPNLSEIKRAMSMETIGFDKLNQLRQLRYLKNAEHTAAVMKRHAAFLKPKFDLCSQKLHGGLDGLGIADWYDPNGGYFISLNVPDGCAKRVWSLMKAAGVTMTPAGATYPYHRDPRDRNLRLAPTYSTLDDLSKTLDVLVCCVKLAACEHYLALRSAS